MIITITGPAGSGKNTVAEKVCEKLGYKLIVVGDLRRQVAKEKGMTIEEFNKWSEENPKEGDEEFDKRVTEEARKLKDCVVVTRVHWHFIPESLKIYIGVEDEEGARRIFEQKKNENSRNETETKSVEEQKEINIDRNKSDEKRYMKLYGINPYDPEHYDLIIDTTGLSIDKIIDSIMKYIEDNSLFNH